MTSSTDLLPMASEAAKLLKALAHPARLMICCQLKGCEMSVGDIEKTLGIKQPRLSRELGKLREEGIVKTRRVSKVVFYTLNSEKAEHVINALCEAMLGADMISLPNPAPAASEPNPTLSSGAGQFAQVSIPTK